MDAPGTVSESSKGDSTTSNVSFHRWVGPITFFFLALVMLTQVLMHADPGGPLRGPVAVFVRDGWNFNELMAKSALALFFGLVLWMLTRRYERMNRLWSSRVVDVLIVVPVLLCGWLFFSAELVRSKSVVRDWDGFIYGIGAKYHPEVGYFDLHPCVVQATNETLIPDNSLVRDLRDYSRKPAREFRNTDFDCRARFTPERWKEFQADISTFDGDPMGFPRMPRRVIRDLGMNGAPLQVFVASKLARWFWKDYRSACLLTLVDVFALCAAFGVAARWLGWRASALLAVAAFTICVDRYFVTGGSLCRYLWLASAVVGFSALATRRWEFAGVFLVLAGGFGAFPSVFAVGALIPLAVADFRARALSAPTRRLLIAMTITAVVAFALPLTHGQGIGNYTDFLEDMRVHGAPRPVKKGKPVEGFAGYGVGLKWAWAYRGEHFTGKMNKRALTRQLGEVKWLLELFALTLSIYAAAIASRQPPAKAAWTFGFTVFFLAFGGAGYYFASVNLALVGLWIDRNRPATAIAIVSLLSVSTLGCWFLAHGGHIFVMHRSVCSLGWLVWLVGYLVWQGSETGVNADLARRLAAPSRADPHPTPDFSPEAPPPPDRG